MRFRYIAAAVALIAAAGRPVAAQDEKEKQEHRKIANDARAVLKTHCFRCHSGEGSSTPYKFDVTDHDTLVKPVGKARPVVVPKNAAKSGLWQAVEGERMPQVGSKEVEGFDQAKMDVIKKWIDAGAPPFPQPGEHRKFLSTTDALGAVLAHLQKVQVNNPQDASSFRYFTLTNVHNNPQMSDDDLAYHRAALSKVINSLSWKSRLVIPEAVDKDNTVYAVNIKELDWDRGKLWDVLLESYPYGLKFGGHPDQQLRGVEDLICKLSGSQYPVLRADWFVATASRPPLYHTLLFDEGMESLRKRDADKKNPANPKHMTAYDLEAALSVDVAENFEKDKLARAAFARSGVSGQNRMVERHDAKYGAYWKSYDFLPDAGRGRLIRFPLGPEEFVGSKYANPYKNQAFRHDGGEIIFNLPNGLQGYMLLDGKDRRIDTGPIQVVSDNNRVSGTFEIVNGVSCMSCHAHGMIRFTDTLRDKTAVFNQAADKVRRLYPEPAKMNAFLDEDEARFIGAAKKAMFPYLPGADAADADFKKYREPASVVSTDYRLRYLNLKAIAVEVGLEKGEDLRAALGDAKFRRLGLEPLLTGGVISRAEWEAVDGYSLMQEVAKELRMTPFGGGGK